MLKLEPFPHEKKTQVTRRKLQSRFRCRTQVLDSGMGASRIFTETLWEKTIQFCAKHQGRNFSGIYFSNKIMARIYDLEDRLVDYTCRMIDLVEALPRTRSGNYLAGQLIRSCHSPAFNYSESQAAESPGDFIHKLRLVLKELKECRTSLKIIIKKDYIRPSARVTPLFQETEELIAIIGKSIATAEKNKGNS